MNFNTNALNYYTPFHSDCKCQTAPCVFPETFGYGVLSSPGAPLHTGRCLLCQRFHNKNQDAPLPKQRSRPDPVSSKEILTVPVSLYLCFQQLLLLRDPPGQLVKIVVIQYMHHIIGLNQFKNLLYCRIGKGLMLVNVTDMA